MGHLHPGKDLQVDCICGHYQFAHDYGVVRCNVPGCQCCVFTTKKGKNLGAFQIAPEGGANSGESLPPDSGTRP